MKAHQKSALKMSIRSNSDSWKGIHSSAAVASPKVCKTDYSSGFLIIILAMSYLKTARLFPEFTGIGDGCGYPDKRSRFPRQWGDHVDLHHPGGGTGRWRWETELTGERQVDPFESGGQRSTSRSGEPSWF